MSVEKKVSVLFSAAQNGAPASALVKFESLLEVPSGGTTGQILVKTADGYAWSNAPLELPVGGTEGQILVKTAEGGLAWANAPLELPAGGTDGQVLAVNAEGALVWVTPAAAPIAPFTAEAIALLANGDYKLHIVDGVPTWVAIV